MGTTQTKQNSYFSWPTDRRQAFKIFLSALLFGASLIALYRYHFSTQSPTGKSLISKLRGDQLYLDQRFRTLKKKITKMYDHNPSLIYTQVQDVQCIQSGIPFNIATMTNAQQQQQLNRSHTLENQLSRGSQPLFRKSDVFLEPFEEGICIDDNLTKTHRLLFNKYPAWNYHVLVITKEKEKQGDLINQRDIEASLLTMKTLDGFLYYNSGPVSGASQGHKHLQIVPAVSLPNRKIPINERVMDTIRRSQTSSRYNSNGAGSASEEEQFFILPEYQSFRHILRKMDANCYERINNDQQLKTYSLSVLSAYHQCLQKLDNADGTLPYNFVMTKDWMFMVLRKQADYQGVQCNSLGYLGLLFARNEEQKQLIMDAKPIEFLQTMAVPMYGGNKYQHDL